MTKQTLNRECKKEIERALDKVREILIYEKGLSKDEEIIRDAIESVRRELTA